MQIIDFQNTTHPTSSSSKKTITLEIAAASLIFLVPALVLFILAN